MAFEGTKQAILSRRAQEQDLIRQKQQISAYNIATLTDLAERLKQARKVEQLGAAVGEFDPTSEASLANTISKMAAIDPVSFGGTALQYGAGLQSEQRKQAFEREITGQQISSQEDIAAQRVASNERIAGMEQRQRRQQIWSQDIGQNAQIFTQESLAKAQAPYEQTGYIPSGMLQLRPEVIENLSRANAGRAGSGTKFQPLSKDQWEKTAGTIMATIDFQNALKANPAFEEKVVEKGGLFRRAGIRDTQGKLLQATGKLTPAERLEAQQSLDAQRDKAFLAYLLYDPEAKIPSNIAPQIKLLKASVANDPVALAEYLQTLPESVRNELNLPNTVAGIVVQPGFEQANQNLTEFEQTFGKQGTTP